MKSVVFILIVIFSLQAQAQFSCFEQIESDSDYMEHWMHEEIHSLRVEKRDDGSFLVKVPELSRKHVWLITCSGELADDQNEFRESIWKSDLNDSHIDVPVEPGDSPAPSCTKDDLRAENGFVEVVLSANLMSRSYIYIDYPRPLFDGGCYYTINLPAYLRKMNASET